MSEFSALYCLRPCLFYYNERVLQMYVHPCFIKWFALLYIALNAAHEGLLSWNGHAAPAAAVAGIGLVKTAEAKGGLHPRCSVTRTEKAIIFRV